MSGINGIELIHALRETLHPVQFIVLSGYDDFEYVRGAFQNGAIDYLLKPVLNDDLTRVVAAALSILDANYRDPGKQRGTLFQFSADVLRKIVSLPISAPVPASLITNMEQIGIGPNCCIALVASLTPWNSDEATAYSNQIYDNFHHVLCNTIAESKLCILCDAKDYESLLAFLFLCQQFCHTCLQCHRSISGHAGCRAVPGSRRTARSAASLWLWKNFYHDGTGTQRGTVPKIKTSGHTVSGKSFLNLRQCAAYHFLQGNREIISAGSSEFFQYFNEILNLTILNSNTGRKNSPKVSLLTLPPTENWKNIFITG